MSSQGTSLAGQRDGAGGDHSAETLPQGASHWDHIPTELRSAILRADTSLLSRFTSGELTANELLWLTDSEREEMWSDALSTDWSGDFSTLILPSVRRGMPDIRSRAVLGKGKLWLFPVKVGRAVLRNGWHDLRSSVAQTALAAAAAMEGDVQLLAQLVETLQTVPVSLHLAVAAATANQVEAFVWIASRLPADTSTHKLLKTAAARQGSPVGHIGHRSVAFIVRAAVEAGAVAILDYLDEEFPDLFRLQGPHVFLSVTSLESLKWLHAHGLIVVPRTNLNTVLAQGNASSAAWIYETFGMQPTADDLEAACQYENPAAFLWILARTGPTIIFMHLNNIVWTQRLTCIDAVMRHSTELMHETAEMICAFQTQELLDWVHSRYPAAITQRTLETSVRSSKLTHAQYLLENVRHVEWDFEAARAVAQPGFEDRFAALFDEHVQRRAALAAGAE
ncbi:hypothetical protein HK105_204184 [Polyrhizophydium stewartii]|uniref:Uncharacterized protein n=1 Tax=Polyrhizophydium stewartii TaxID=2732419 RepID=A0ABR4N988_9FUNG|nr:hypothetical protein HK105_005260 [Polyrhizophydium stewartii]